MIRLFARVSLALSLALTALSPAAASPIDLVALERVLSTDGLEGRIHGAVEGQGLYVFTYRAPNDFFTMYNFPMVAAGESIQAQLATLSRHDKVWIKGRYVPNPAPQRHILVEELRVVERWPGDGVPPYEHDVVLPDDLGDRGTLVARVHAVAAEGRVLVIEHRDVVIPVFVRDATVTRTLWRGDKIRLAYVVRDYPDQPVHLSPDPQAGAGAVEVIERLEPKHGSAVVMEGALVKFPQSPQIIFDVFALQAVDEHDVVLEHTLVNFDSPETFAAIRAKLARAWDEHAAHAVNGRNKLVNRKLIVRATGTYNVVSPEQANPQILLRSADDVEVRFVP